VTRPARRTLLLAAAVLLLAGCGPTRDYGPLAEISGSVTIDGKPLASGTLSLVTPATGDLQVFEVTGGRFAGQARVGERRVEVRSYAPLDLPAAGGKDARSDLPGPTEFPVNSLPDHLSAYSTLTTTITADGPNDLTFDLSTDQPR
jgi:hypothetical protein